MGRPITDGNGEHTLMRARRLEIVDEYVDEGRAAVYSSNGVVVLLSELATSAWCLLRDDWVTSYELADRLVLEYGPPDGGGAVLLTEQTLQSLADMDLVELTSDA